jgi:choriolysin L
MEVLTNLLILAIFECVIGARYFESLPEANSPQFGHHRNAMKMEQYKWPNGVIPYEISEEYSAREIQSIYKAIQSFHSETCVRFIPKNLANQVESIRFVKGPGCGAQVGFRKNRTEPMAVMYDTLCLRMPGAVQHEMFHVVGLFHEHNRPDRDEYLDIFYENVEERKI